eukprot:2725679-Alexandrium_andersonii.AAC.1
MDLLSAQEKPGLGFLNSRWLSLSGFFRELPSCCRWVCFARTWASGFCGRPMPFGRSSCSRHGTS